MVDSLHVIRHHQHLPVPRPRNMQSSLQLSIVALDGRRNSKRHGSAANSTCGEMVDLDELHVPEFALHAAVMFLVGTYNHTHSSTFFDSGASRYQDHSI